MSFQDTPDTPDTPNNRYNNNYTNNTNNTNITNITNITNNNLASPGGLRGGQYGQPTPFAGRVTASQHRRLLLRTLDRAASC